MERLLVAGLSGLSLIAGTLVYLVWRGTSIYAFRWLGTVGLIGPVLSLRLWAGDLITPSGWWLESLPGGLWALSGALAMRVVWWRNHSAHSRCWLAAVPALGVCSEIGQLAGVPGTFDIGDLAAYGLAVLFAIVVTHLVEGRV